MRATHRKSCLPNYKVFDEKRYFKPGAQPTVVEFRGFRIGLLVCEDIWEPEPAQLARSAGAEMFVVINASPFEVEKHERRVQLGVARVVETGLPFVFLAQVCGQDELVFDGSSFVLNPDRSLAAVLPMFEEAVTLTEWRREGGRLVCARHASSPARGAHHRGSARS